MIEILPTLVTSNGTIWWLLSKAKLEKPSSFFYPKFSSVVPVFALTAMPSGAVPRSQDKKFHLSHQNQMPLAKIRFECPYMSVTAVQPMTQNETSHHHWNPSGSVLRGWDQKFHLSYNRSHHHQNQKLEAKISVTDIKPKLSCR